MIEKRVMKYNHLRKLLSPETMNISSTARFITTNADIVLAEFFIPSMFINENAIIAAIAK